MLALQESHPHPNPYNLTMRISQINKTPHYKEAIFIYNIYNNLDIMFGCIRICSGYDDDFVGGF